MLGRFRVFHWKLRTDSSKRLPDLRDCFVRLAQMTLSCWKILLITVVPMLSACERIHDQFRVNTNTNQADSNSSLTAVPLSVHLAFGNPSNATQDPAKEDNFLVVGEGSAFSYNNSRSGVNWVAWRTTREDVGNPIPRPDFRPDPRLPKWYKRIGYYDYSGSGYDRGHMVPSADRFGNPRLNEETFMMSNIVPQTGALNQFPWNKFEMYVRSQVRRKLDVYQIAGCYGEAGRLKNKVTIPTNCWKIAAILPRGGKPEQIDARTRIIAVDMPNIEGIENANWQAYRTTIREIEQRTGLNIFADRPQQFQDAVETREEMVSR